MIAHNYSFIALLLLLWRPCSDSRRDTALYKLSCYYYSCCCCGTICKFCNFFFKNAVFWRANKPVQLVLTGIGVPISFLYPRLPPRYVNAPSSGFRCLSGWGCVTTGTLLAVL